MKSGRMLGLIVGTVTILIFCFVWISKRTVKNKKAPATEKLSEEHSPGQ